MAKTRDPQAVRLSELHAERDNLHRIRREMRRDFDSMLVERYAMIYHLRRTARASRRRARNDRRAA